MAEIIGVTILLAVMTLIAILIMAADRRRNSLPEDDGIVWNTEIDKRLSGGSEDK